MRSEKRFFNGKIGIISSINEDKIVVRSEGIDINVNKLDWENITYSIDGDTKQIKENIIGTFTQYPLRLAWAITIHKSQGLTFEKVVIDAENAFANGQVYVALSRATTLEGLILTSRVNDQFLGAHSDLKTWQQNNHNENSLPELFKSSRESFMKHELFGVFTFDQFRNALHSLKKEIDENTTDTEVKKWHKELNEKLNTINFTANKFKETLKVIWNENSEAQTNEKLNTRVKDASVYFSNQLNDWKKILLNHPLKFNNRRTSGKIDKTIEALNDILTIYMTKLNICLEGFKFNDLIAWKKFIKAKKEEIKSSYHSGKKEKGEKSVDQSELYDRISDFRKELAEENDTPLFMIFSNQAIKHCCELLPGDKKTLLAVDGFGKKKVSEYGDEVLRIIQEYCEDNNIDVNYLDEKKIKNIEYEKSFRISPTVQQTIDLLKSGKSISEICAERNLASSTIESHLANGIKNRLVDIESILPKSEIETISAFFKTNSFELKNAREKAGAEISYGKLKMVQAWLMVGKDN